MNRALSLTFDDGPDPRWTLEILKALRRLEVRATFFMVGERISSTPATVQAVIDAGHEIQLHCARHIRHTDLSEAGIDADARSGLETLTAHGAPRPTLWRTPWGVLTPASERVAPRHGLQLVGWTIDTHDWRGDGAAEMLRAAESLLAADGCTLSEAPALLPGHVGPLSGAAEVVLMHDALGPGALRDGCQNTVDLIDGLVATARARGMETRPLGEVLSAANAAGSEDRELRAALA